MVSQEFVVLDTEGTPLLREVALFDHRGQLLYEARTPQEGDYYAADLAHPLPEILRQLSPLLQGKTIVAHNADHDRQILLNSYAEVGLAAPVMQFECTCELARSLHWGLDSYNLGYLCDVLEVSPEPFSRDQAHQAVYDARYTYYLYRTLKRSQLGKTLAAGPNPFSSSRVDTPFQHFADDQAVYQDEYQRLKSVLHSISLDPNHQSKGAVIIGEPGTGKTHLMMRLAQDVLKQNRLLFIRQPTQESTILFHTYSRILESLVVEVADDARHNQLDLLLIRSIRRIFAEIPEDRQSVGDREILEALNAEDLSSLGREDTAARRQRWERIESRLLTWWADRYSVSGYSRQILQGILRFCRYKDPARRESCRRWLSSGELVPVDRELEGLSAWDNELMREEFSLQAIKILGALSCLDQPLIIVFDQLEGLWLEDNRPILLRFGEVVKELFTHVPNSLFILTLFPDRWQKFQQDFDGSIVDRVAQHTVYLQRPTAEQLEEILNLRLRPLNVGALDLFTAEDLAEITQQRSIRASLNRANEFYAHRVQGVPLPAAMPLLTSTGSADASLANRVLHLEQQVQQLQTLIQKLLASPVAGSSGISEEVRVEVIEAIAQPVSVVSNSPFAPEFHRYCSYQRRTLQERWSGARIINDSDDLGKLRQICQAFKQVKSLEISALRLGRCVVPDNLVICDRQGARCLAFLHISNGTSICARLTNFNQLVLSHPNMIFILMRDRTVGDIQSPKASQALAAFCNGTGDGRKRTHYQVLSLEQRVDLELVHQLVSDINNRDLEIPMPDALNLLVQQEPQNWIVRLVARAESL